MDYRSCFIIMPFSKANELEKKDLDFVYEEIIQRTVSEFQVNDEIYFQEVKRFNSNVGSIIQGIVDNLNDADLVIADLSGLNPNVMYELGVRHALRNGTIMITQDLTTIPSDLRDYLTVEYSYSKDTLTHVANLQKFKKSLHTAIDEIISTNKCDSPVLTFLEQRKRFRNEIEVQKVKDNFVVVHSISTIIHEIDDMINGLNHTTYSANVEITLNQLFNLKISTLLSAIEKLNISYSSKLLFSKIINVKILVQEISRMFSKNLELIKISNGLSSLTTGFGINQMVLIELINIFSLDLGKLEHYQIKEIFKKDGPIYQNLIQPLIIHIDRIVDEYEIEKDEFITLLS